MTIVGNSAIVRRPGLGKAMGWSMFRLLPLRDDAGRCDAEAPKHGIILSVP
jgi:hypothetical protein